MADLNEKNPNSNADSNLDNATAKELVESDEKLSTESTSSIAEGDENVASLHKHHEKIDPSKGKYAYLNDHIYDYVINILANFSPQVNEQNLKRPRWEIRQEQKIKDKAARKTAWLALKEGEKPAFSLADLNMHLYDYATQVRNGFILNPLSEEEIKNLRQRRKEQILHVAAVNVKKENGIVYLTTDEVLDLFLHAAVGPDKLTYLPNAYLDKYHLRDNDVQFVCIDNKVKVPVQEFKKIAVSNNRNEQLKEVSEGYDYVIKMNENGNLYLKQEQETDKIAKNQPITEIDDSRVSLQTKYNALENPEKSEVAPIQTIENETIITTVGDVNAKPVEVVPSDQIFVSQEEKPILTNEETLETETEHAVEIYNQNFNENLQKQLENNQGNASLQDLVRTSDADVIYLTKKEEAQLNDYLLDENRQIYVVEALDAAVNFGIINNDDAQKHLVANGNVYEICQGEESSILKAPFGTLSQKYINDSVFFLPDDFVVSVERSINPTFLKMPNFEVEVQEVAFRLDKNKKDHWTLGNLKDYLTVANNTNKVDFILSLNHAKDLMLCNENSEVVASLAELSVGTKGVNKKINLIDIFNEFTVLATNSNHQFDRRVKKIYAMIRQILFDSCYYAQDHLLVLNYAEVLGFLVFYFDLNLTHVYDLAQHQENATLNAMVNNALERKQNFIPSNMLQTGNNYFLNGQYDYVLSNGVLLNIRDNKPVNLQEIDQVLFDRPDFTTASFSDMRPDRFAFLQSISPFVDLVSYYSQIVQPLINLESDQDTVSSENADNHIQADTLGKEVVEETKKVVNNTNQGVKGIVKGTLTASVNLTKNLMKDTVDLTKKTVKTTLDVTKTVAKEGYNATKNVVRGTVDLTKHAVQNTVEFTKDVVVGTTHVAKATVNVAKDAAVNLTETSATVAKDIIHGSPDFAKDVVQGTKKLVKDTAYDTVDVAKQTAALGKEAAVDAVATGIDTSKDVVSATYQTAKDVTLDTKKILKTTAVDSVDVGKQAVTTTKDLAKDTVKTGVDLVKSTSKEVTEVAATTKKENLTEAKAIENNEPKVVNEGVLYLKQKDLEHIYQHSHVLANGTAYIDKLEAEKYGLNNPNVKAISIDGQIIPLSPISKQEMEHDLEREQESIRVAENKKNSKEE